MQMESWIELFASGTGALGKGLSRVRLSVKVGPIAREKPGHLVDLGLEGFQSRPVNRPMTELDVSRVGPTTPWRLGLNGNEQVPYARGCLNAVKRGTSSR